MNCGIDCDCKECEKIRKLLRDSEKSGKIHLVGSPKDIKKIRKEKKEVGVLK